MQNPLKDDEISEVQWLYICRDIFGINTFEIDEELPEIMVMQLEEEVEEAQE